MLVDAREWIEKVSADGATPPLSSVERWIKRGNILGRWENGILWVDPDTLRDDSDLHKAPEAPRKQATGWVYLLGAPELRRVKIGWTIDRDKRIATLQRQSPTELVPLAFIKAAPQRERELHKVFADRRVLGEWFEDCPEIRSEFGVT